MVMRLSSLCQMKLNQEFPLKYRQTVKKTSSLHLICLHFTPTTSALAHKSFPTVSGINHMQAITVDRFHLASSIHLEDFNLIHPLLPSSPVT